MFDKDSFKQMVTGALILGLFILAGIIIKPVIIAIILGILLAYILYPVYNKKDDKKQAEARCLP